MGKREGKRPLLLADDLSAEARRHIEKLHEENPFLALIGARVTEVRRGRVQMEAEIGHEVTNVYGIAHGAIAMALADTAMGGACFSLGRRVMTLEMGMNFLRPLEEGAAAIAVGEVIHSGNHTMVCEARVVDEAGELCLKAQGTFFVMDEPTDGKE